MKFVKLSESENGKVFYLAEKMKDKKRAGLYFKIAFQIGIDKLEKAIGLTLEDPKINNKPAYMVAICKSYGYKI